jgi:hypothetical protein
LAAGTFLPAGKGAFIPQGYGAYSFLAVTQCFGEDENVLIHGNIGVNYAYQAGFRYFISDLIQVDAEFGQGLSGKEKIPFWLGFGARFVIPKFSKKS